MTANQIAYQQLLHKKWYDGAYLEEVARHNGETEKEAFRSNTTNEAIKWGQLDLGNRQLAVQAKYQSEDLKIKEYSAVTNRQHYERADRIARDTLEESKRVNSAKIEQGWQTIANDWWYKQESIGVQKYNAQSQRISSNASMLSAQASMVNAQANTMNAQTNAARLAFDQSQYVEVTVPTPFAAVSNGKITAPKGLVSVKDAIGLPSQVKANNARAAFDQVRASTHERDAKADRAQKYSNVYKNSASAVKDSLDSASKLMVLLGM